MDDGKKWKICVPQSQEWYPGIGVKGRYVNVEFQIKDSASQFTIVGWQYISQFMPLCQKPPSLLLLWSVLSLHLVIIICLCVCALVCVHVCHSVYRDLFLPCGTWGIELRSLALKANALSYWFLSLAPFKPFDHTSSYLMITFIAIKSLWGLLLVQFSNFTVFYLKICRVWHEVLVVPHCVIWNSGLFSKYLEMFFP